MGRPYTLGDKYVWLHWAMIFPAGFGCGFAIGTGNAPMAAILGMLLGFIAALLAKYLRFLYWWPEGPL